MQGSKKNVTAKLIVCVLAAGTLTGFSVNPCCAVKITVTNNTENSSIDGGIGDGNADYNEITISGSTVKSVTGGRANFSSSNYNKVEITDSTVNDYIIGGRSFNTSGENNEVSITNTTVNGDIYGGAAASVSSGNTITITDSEFGSVYGGAGTTDRPSSISFKYVNGYADKNTITISGSKSKGSGSIVGGYGKLSANENEIIIENGAEIGSTGSSSGMIVGGLSNGGSADSNSITIQNSSVSSEQEITAGHGVTTADGNSLTIQDSTVSSEMIASGYTDSGSAKENNLVIQYSAVTGSMITAGYGAEAEYNSVTIDNSMVIGDVYAAVGGDVNNNTITRDVNNNTITIRGENTNLENAGLYGRDSAAEGTNNTLVIEDKDWSGNVKDVGYFDSIKFTQSGTSLIVAAETVTGIGNLDLTSINEADNYVAGDYKEGTTTFDCGYVTVSNNLADIEVLNKDEYIYGDRDDNGLYVNRISMNDYKEPNDENTTTINLEKTVEKTVVTGTFTDDNGTYTNSNGNGTLTVDENFSTTNASVVSGSYASGDNDATGGNVIITGDYDGTVYAGYSESGSVNDNTISIASGTNAGSTNIIGRNTAEGSGNSLAVSGSNVEVNSVNNFDSIELNDIDWKDGETVLTINNNGATSDLSGTSVNINSFKGGSTFKLGDTMAIIDTKDKDIGIDEKNVTDYAWDDATAGVTTNLEGKKYVDKGNLYYTVTKVEANPQLNLVAENRAVSAAFLNQGGDLVSDGLTALYDQYGYGFKTFVEVYGNRSTYDVNSDLKINGWSEIVGLGEKKRYSDSDFAYAVFYENGSGNYRTYNEFNNEFFRGDGSLVYNGGGIAARLKKDDGMYYEGSLRAGTLKSEMNNALKDGAGNSYGYKSDSTYYGAHVGIGKITKIGEDRELDIYGKFFHTYVDGDDFSIAGDIFSFDSITSDRLRVGADLRTNAQNTWSMTYGLAYEYEFNGDSDMKAGQFTMPTQSLEGGTVIGKIGLSYRDEKYSPWTFDLDLRAYRGQRDGFSGNVLLTYNF